MKCKIDGDQLMICADSFVNLQESPALFIPLDGELAKAILAEDDDAVEDNERWWIETESKAMKQLNSMIWHGLYDPR